MSWLRKAWQDLRRLPGWIVALLTLLLISAIFWMREARRRSRLAEIERQRRRIEERVSRQLLQIEASQEAERAILLAHRADRVSYLNAERDRIEAAALGDKEAFADEWARVFGRR